MNSTLKILENINKTIEDGLAKIEKAKRRAKTLEAAKARFDRTWAAGVAVWLIDAAREDRLSEEEKHALAQLFCRDGLAKEPACALLLEALRGKEAAE